MSDIVPKPESNVEIRTLDRGDIGLSFRRRLIADTQNGKKILDTPAKTIPVAKLYQDDQISDVARGANEFYAEVSSSSLEDIRMDGNGIHHEGLENQTQSSRLDEFDFSFLDYTDAHQISKIEAFQMAGVLSEYSDFLTVPRQKKLYSEVEDGNGLDDTWYQRFRNGTELFLQACIELDPETPIMGAIPPLGLEHLEDLINLYEQYDVYAFYLDFNWNNVPTKPNQVARMQFLMRRIRNQRIHDDVLFYAINVRRGKFNENLGYTPAVNIASVALGIDIVGGNHSTPDWPEEVFENMEKNNDFDVYCPEIMGYIKSPPERLQKNIPDNSTIDISDVAKRSAMSSTTRRKYQKILNSELQSLDLAKLREALENGTLDEFIESRRIVDEFLNAGQAVKAGFEEGAQSQLGEFTSD